MGKGDSPPPPHQKQKYAEKIQECLISPSHSDSSNLYKTEPNSEPDISNGTSPTKKIKTDSPLKQIVSQTFRSFMSFAESKFKTSSPLEKHQVQSPKESTSLVSIVDMEPQSPKEDDMEGTNLSSNVYPESSTPVVAHFVELESTLDSSSMDTVVINLDTPTDVASMQEIKISDLESNTEEKSISSENVITEMSLACKSILTSTDDINFESIPAKSCVKTEHIPSTILIDLKVTQSQDSLEPKEPQKKSEENLVVRSETITTLNISQLEHVTKTFAEDILSIPENTSELKSTKNENRSESIKHCDSPLQEIAVDREYITSVDNSAESNTYLKTTTLQKYVDSNFTPAPIISIQLMSNSLYENSSEPEPKTFETTLLTSKLKQEKRECDFLEDVCLRCASRNLVLVDRGTSPINLWEISSKSKRGRGRPRKGSTPFLKQVYIPTGKRRGRPSRQDKPLEILESAIKLEPSISQKNVDVTCSRVLRPRKPKINVAITSPATVKEQEPPKLSEEVFEKPITVKRRRGRPSLSNKMPQVKRENTRLPVVKWYESMTPSASFCQPWQEVTPRQSTRKQRNKRLETKSSGTQILTSKSAWIESKPSSTPLTSASKKNPPPPLIPIPIKKLPAPLTSKTKRMFPSCSHDTKVPPALIPFGKSVTPRTLIPLGKSQPPILNPQFKLVMINPTRQTRNIAASMILKQSEVSSTSSLHKNRKSSPPVDTSETQPTSTLLKSNGVGVPPVISTDSRKMSPVLTPQDRSMASLSLTPHGTCKEPPNLNVQQDDDIVSPLPLTLPATSEVPSTLIPKLPDNNVQPTLTPDVSEKAKPNLVMDEFTYTKLKEVKVTYGRKRLLSNEKLYAEEKSATASKTLMENTVDAFLPLKKKPFICGDEIFNHGPELELLSDREDETCDHGSESKLFSDGEESEVEEKVTELEKFRQENIKARLEFMAELQLTEAKESLESSMLSNNSSKKRKKKEKRQLVLPVREKSKRIKHTATSVSSCVVDPTIPASSFNDPSITVDITEKKKLRGRPYKKNAIQINKPSSALPEVNSRMSLKALKDNCKFLRVLKKDIDKSLTLCDLEEFRERFKGLTLGQCIRASHQVRSIAIHPSKRIILAAVGCKDGHLGLWSVDPDKVLEKTSPEVSSSNVVVLKPHSDSILSTSFSSLHFNILYTTGKDSTLRRIDVKSKSYDLVYTSPNCGEGNLTSHSEMTPHVIMVGTKNGRVAKVDLRASKEAVVTYKAYPNNVPVRSISVHPSNTNRMVTTSAEGVVALWDVRKMCKSQGQVTGLISSVIFSEDPSTALLSPVTGKKLLTTNSNNTISVFDMTDEVYPKLVNTFCHYNGSDHWSRLPCRAKASWHPQREDVILVGSLDKPRSVQIFKTDGTEVLSLRSPDLMTSACEMSIFHPSLPVVLASSYKGFVHLFK